MMDDAPIRALIFDMDGTLIDNMRFHDQSWCEWHGLHGLPFDAEGFTTRTAGQSLGETIRQYFPEASAEALDELGASKEAIYRALYAPHVQPIAGLLDFLAMAEAAAVPMAVGTAAPPENVAMVLDGLALRARFRTIASPSDGLRGKPHPDIFLAAAARMGVLPSECIVFEDAPLGVEAARRAGMRAIALTTMLGADAFEAFPNCLGAIQDFTALSTLSRWPGLR